MKPIRNSAKAVIVRNDRLLLTKNEDGEGYFYLFPGGGQEKGEELKDAVVRECKEEIGQEVEVEELLFVREYIGEHHQFAEWDADVHQVEFYFRCRLTDPEADMGNGAHPDEHQVGVEWVLLSRLGEIRVYPGTLAEKLRIGVCEPCYVGDVG
ncbi:NUDIX domain-containing protein [Cohnella cellulosilytica]|uniref:NUDIX domain-containing protein n=1 Tax=Cohnella cellulosilytica TaxID=986710 RepID=A0ABW2FD14_9BACL